MDIPTGEHPGKYPLHGHNAITGKVVNSAFIVALFADLGNFYNGGHPQAQFRPNGHLQLVDTLGGDILCEVSKADVQPLVLHSGNALGCKETDLTVPCAAVGIAGQAMVFNQSDAVDPALARALFFADGQGDNLHNDTSFGMGQKTLYYNKDTVHGLQFFLDKNH